MAELIKAFKKDQDLKDELHQEVDKGKIRIWWLGQSGFIVKTTDICILFDPYLSDSLTEKYKVTDKPHVRISERVIDPNYLPKIDILFSSHNHTDHLDVETLLPVIEKNPEIKFIIPNANRSFVAKRLKCDENFPLGLNDQQQLKTGQVNIFPLAAAHNEIERDENGHCKFLSYFVEIEGFRMYHSGDTLWYDNLEHSLRDLDIDLAFLPINGNKPERKVAGNLNYLEAAALAKSAKIKLTIPHHYHMFEFNTEDPDNFEKACQLLNVKYKILQLGESLELNLKEKLINSS